MSGIGIIVALPREIPVGFVRLDRRREQSASLPFATYRYKFGPPALLAAQVGIGCARAAGLTRQFVARFSPAVLVSLGFAGGLNPHLTRGTIVIASGLVSPTRAPPQTAAHQGLVEQFQAAARAERLPFCVGCLTTVTNVVADATAKAALWQATGADAVDMETAGIAQAASESNLPWVAVRSIVDTAVESIPAGCLNTIDEDGRISVAALLAGVAHSPSLLRYVVRFAVGSRMARRRLSRLLASWVIQRPPEEA